MIGIHVRRALSVVLAAALTAGIAAGCQWNVGNSSVTASPARTPAAGASTARPVTSSVAREFAVGASPSLVVESQAGAITIEAGDAGKIAVEAIKSAKGQTALDRIEVGLKQDGDAVRLSYRLPQGMGAVASGNPEVEFRVRTPAGAKVELSTEVGEIRIVGLSAGATVTTNVGSISSRSVKGSQELTTTTGSIAVTGAAGQVRASVGEGAIEVEGDLAGESWLRARAGAVTARLPSAASLRVSSVGSSFRNDFGLIAEGNRLTGNVGSGERGSLEIASNGLVQLLRN